MFLSNIQNSYTDYTVTNTGSETDAGLSEMQGNEKDRRQSNKSNTRANTKSTASLWKINRDVTGCCC